MCAERTVKNFSPLTTHSSQKSIPILTFPKEWGRKCAFTLAEVLITLGIIGVVVALTLPPLIQNYQKQVLVTQLKKFYSTWEQGFQKILADEGVERLSDTELWGKMNDTISSYTNPTNSIEFYKGLQKYIKFEIPTQKEEYKVGYSAYILKTPDGMSIISYSFNKTPNTKDKATCDKIKEMGGRMCNYI